MIKKKCRQERSRARGTYKRWQSVTREGRMGYVRDQGYRNGEESSKLEIGSGKRDRVRK